MSSSGKNHLLYTLINVRCNHVTAGRNKQRYINARVIEPEGSDMRSIAEVEPLQMVIMFEREQETRTGSTTSLGTAD